MAVDDTEDFERDRMEWAAALGVNDAVQRQSIRLFEETDKHNFSYLWSWLGMPIIQTPTDIITTQEIIWKNRPDLIIETGVARGGSLVFLASILELIGEGRVLGIDIDIRQHNYQHIVDHPMSRRIDMIEGSSVDDGVLNQVKARVLSANRVMVILDSNHTHEHVLAELERYAPLVSPGQYLIVADTIIEYIEPHPQRPRPWGAGNNPKSALDQFLKRNADFEPDAFLNAKLMVSATVGGYLRRIR